MTVQTLKLGGKRFVVVPEADFKRLRQQAEDNADQDRGDVAESKRRKGKGRSLPYSQLRKKLGLT